MIKTYMLMDMISSWSNASNGQ